MDTSPPPNTPAPAEPKPSSVDRTNLWIIGCFGVGLIGSILVVVALFFSAVSKMPSQTVPMPESTPQAQSPLGVPVPPGRFVAATGQTIYLDLDTQAGHNSSWRKDDVRPYSALYARLNVMRLGSYAMSPPGFWIGVKGESGDQFRNAVGMRISPSGRGLALQIARVGAGTFAQTYGFSARPVPNQQIGITIDWSTPHWVAFTLSDGEVQRVQIPWSVSGAGLYASTGEVIADPLQLGTMAANGARSGRSSR